VLTARSVRHPDPVLIEVVRAVRRLKDPWRLGSISARSLLLESGVEAPAELEVEPELPVAGQALTCTHHVFESTWSAALRANLALARREIQPEVEPERERGPEAVPPARRLSDEAYEAETLEWNRRFELEWAAKQTTGLATVPLGLVPAQAGQQHPLESAGLTTALPLGVTPGLNTIVALQPVDLVVARPVIEAPALAVTDVTHALDAVGVTVGSPDLGVPALLKQAMTQAARASAYRNRKASRDVTPRDGEPVTCNAASVTQPKSDAERARAYRERKKARDGTP
jgi:hypothetical protein